MRQLFDERPSDANWLQEIDRRMPLLLRQMESNISLTTGAYLANQISHSPARSRPDDIFLNAVEKVATETHGPDLSRLCRIDQEFDPVFLTANHHGIDTFADSIQATMQFGNFKMTSDYCPKTVLVLACASVSLNNPTSPAGLRFYKNFVCSRAKNWTFVKLFASSQNQVMISHARPYTSAAVEELIKQINQRKLDQAGVLCYCEGAVGLIRELLLRADVIESGSFLEQAIKINRDIWSKICSDKGSLPELVFLSIEQVCSEMLIAELSNDQSLTSMLLFDCDFLFECLIALNGCPTCWTFDSSADESIEIYQRSLLGGTILFWGVTQSGRRIPLMLNKSADHWYLRSVYQTNDTFSCELSKASIIDNICNKKIVPSYFLCMFLLSVLRNLTCVGGYYQHNYLPQIHAGINRAFSKIGLLGRPFHEESALDMRPATIAGLQPFACRANDELLCTAGPIEIISAGGIAGSDLRRSLKVPVRIAAEMALPDLLPDIISDPHELSMVTEKVRSCSAALVDSIVLI